VEKAYALLFLFQRNEVFDCIAVDPFAVGNEERVYLRDRFSSGS